MLCDKSRPHKHSWDFPLRGLMKCDICGCAIIGVHKKKPSGREYTYYSCSKRRGNCGQRPIRAKELEAQVEEKIKAIERF